MINESNLLVIEARVNYDYDLGKSDRDHIGKVSRVDRIHSKRGRGIHDSIRPDRAQAPLLDR